MLSKQIFLDEPNVGEKEKEYLIRAVEKNFLSTYGPYVGEFENKFSNYVHAKGAVAIQSGTAAIFMALRECGIGPGDEVIVPALTFVASVNPIIYLGAKPVYVDVDELTWTIDLTLLEKAITPKTKAVIVVHLYGNPANMQAIMRVAEKHRVAIIEDATESLGGCFSNKPTGTFGSFGCYSFNGNKMITTGGGGMVVSEDTQKLKHIKYLINQAQSDSEENYQDVGANLRMTNLAASLGLAQMEKLDEFVNKKSQMNRIYREELKNVADLKFQESYEHAVSAYWLTCVRFDNAGRLEKLMAHLKENQIPFRRVFKPVVAYPPYRGDAQHLKNSFKIFDGGLCLPSSTLNQLSDIKHVCQVIKNFFK